MVCVLALLYGVTANLVRTELDASEDLQRGQCCCEGIFSKPHDCRWTNEFSCSFDTKKLPNSYCHGGGRHRRGFNSKCCCKKSFIREFEDCMWTEGLSCLSDGRAFTDEAPAGYCEHHGSNGFHSGLDNGDHRRGSGGGFSMNGFGVGINNGMPNARVPFPHFGHHYSHTTRTSTKYVYKPQCCCFEGPCSEANNPGLGHFQHNKHGVDVCCKMDNDAWTGSDGSSSCSGKKNGGLGWLNPFTTAMARLPGEEDGFKWGCPSDASVCPDTLHYKWGTFRICPTSVTLRSSDDEDDDGAR